jgi:glucose dehydrogenase
MIYSKKEMFYVKNKFGLTIILTLILVLLLSGCYLIHSGPKPGTLKWKYEIGDWTESSPAIGADGTIYVGSIDHYLYAINLDKTLKWRYKTGDLVDSSPTIGKDGTIYAGSSDYYLYAINPYDGNLKWKYETGGWVDSSPAIGADGTIYVGSEDGYLYAINSSSNGLADSPWPMFHHDIRHIGSK